MTTDDNAALSEFARLLGIMRRLRDPETGCPWDVAQDFTSIAPYTIEEAYEVVDAIEREAWPELADELGDLALQVVFHAQMGAEAGHFDVSDVLKAVNDKMVRRHPHIFAEAEATDSDAVRANWETIKTAERAAKRAEDTSRLADIPAALPALMRAQKMQRRAASVGFDWPDVSGALAKLREETGELADALGSPDEAEDELGDVLFSAVNVARKLGLDAELALKRATQKFEGRFRDVEQMAANGGLDLNALNEAELDALWRQAKKAQPRSSK